MNLVYVLLKQAKGTNELNPSPMLRKPPALGRMTFQSPQQSCLSLLHFWIGDFFMLRSVPPLPEGFP